MTEADGEGLASRSRAAVLGRWPGLAAALSRPLQARPIRVGGVVVDLELGGGRFYQGCGRAVAEAQLDAFQARPARLIRGRPELGGAAAGPPTLASRMMALLAEECRRAGIDPAQLPEAPTLPGNLVIAFGIGLGHALPALVRRLRPSELTVVETEAEFLQQSLAAIDWQELLADCDGRDCPVTLILDQDARRIAASIVVRMGARTGPLIDGALLFPHYANPVLVEAAERVRQQAHLSFVTRGSFEDEKIMLANSWANLTAGTRPLLEATPRPERPEPALIVAAGPSLDRDLPHLRRLWPGGVVFSCGTALRICLAHGLRPDFHCESENVAAVPPILEETRATFGLDGLALIASTTVNPLIPPMFSDVTFYFREESVSTRAFAVPGQELVYATPMSANAAAAAAVAMGFRKLILFGVDCGSKQPGRRHADGTAYQILDELILDEQAHQFPQTAPGNFGGTVVTGPFHDWSRLKLGLLVRHSGVQAFNCSDGARIEGATPKAATGIATWPAIDRTGVRAEIQQGLARTTPPGPALARAMTIFSDYFDLVIATADGLAQAPPDPAGAWGRLRRVAAAEGTPAELAAAVFAGTARTLFEAGAYFTGRLPEGEARQTLHHRFLTAFAALVREARTDLLGFGSALCQPSPPTAPNPS